ncbi:MAG TPA: hypothetical protein VGA97_08735, partial [Acidimicrobiia bacterium]
MEAQHRFHRYVAVLFAVIVPALAIIELASGAPGSSLRWVGYAALTVWAFYTARNQDASSVPLLLSTMLFTGALIVIEAL